jgi:hypothetical protein
MWQTGLSHRYSVRTVIGVTIALGCQIAMKYTAKWVEPGQYYMIFFQNENYFPVERIYKEITKHALLRSYE